MTVVYVHHYDNLHSYDCQNVVSNYPVDLSIAFGKVVFPTAIIFRVNRVSAILWLLVSVCQHLYSYVHYYGSYFDSSPSWMLCLKKKNMNYS